jgi:cytochrome c oxidase subunit 2
MDEDISFFSTLSTPWEAVEDRTPKGDHYLLEVDNELVLPVQKKVRFLFTANDVLHAWWVPALGVKKDAIPGFINESWTYIEKPGIYRGQCAEPCGVGHGFMPVVVRAVSQQEYQQWVTEKKAAMPAGAATGARLIGTSPATTDVAQAPQQAPQAPAAAEATPVAAAGDMGKDALMQQGEQVYKARCAACHGAEGQGVPPAFPPIAGSKIATGPVQDHLNIVIKGKPGTAMQAFGNILQDDELAAVVTYQRNALGNSVGDLVQPADVQAAR